MKTDIRHVVVLMLENRSFDGMLGMLRPSGPSFDGLLGTEENAWHKPDGSQFDIQVWTDPTLGPANLSIPDPDPGETFVDINGQIYGLNPDGTLNQGVPTMGGFVDNYMRQPVTNPAPDPYSVMHYFTPNHVPVISQLALAFGVSDRWHASAPCQTWPNRFFVHCGTAGGYVNNSPTHFPYLMETVFNRLSDVGKTWRVYFHDIPQAATLARLWGDTLTHFRRFESEFLSDAAAGNLPEYSFIEPRYFADPLLGKMPNDEHPPHNIAYGEALIATVYNAVRAGPAWPNTLLVITCDEHGGCYDHVAPQSATPPGGPYPDGFQFNRFGVRVPAVIVSPYIRPGSVLRPRGKIPFDHTSIIATLRKLFGFRPLTARDKAAPDLLQVLGSAPTNNGPATVVVPPALSPAPSVNRAAAKPPNDLQVSLSTAALHLPTAGANIDTHIRRLESVPDTQVVHATAGEAASAVSAHMQAFLGK
jgi:phospholipase C